MEEQFHSQTAGIAPGMIGRSVDLDSLIGDGPYFYCRGKMLADSPPKGRVIACSDLCKREVVDDIVTCFARKYAGGDRRAVASVWTLYYFSALTIAASVHLFAHKRHVPLDLERTFIVCDEETAEPQAFVFSGSVEATDVPALDLRQLVTGHLEPVICGFAACARLSPKLLWSNAVSYQSWILKDIGQRHGEELVADALALIDDPLLPDGRKNPMCGMVRCERDACGTEITCRKVCCLRYMVPGIGGCGQSCPLPEGRQ